MTDSCSSNVLSAQSSHALFLVRTPLQGWIARSILLQDARFENYDLLYITQSDSNEDRNQFSLLSQKAEVSSYIYHPIQKKDFMNHFKIRASVPGIFFKKKYGYVLLASLDCPVLNALSAHHKNSLLISFDDGLANVFEHSPYHTGRLPLRAGIVHLLLGSSRISTITERISCHYTIFNGIKSNICASRHVYLDILPVSHGKNLSEGKTKLFVGQPFKEILSNRQLDILRKALLAMKFDYYIKHPREIEPLVDHMPLFRKDEMLAEEAVLAYSSSCNIELFGCTSTSLFLLAGRVKAVNAILPISMKNIDSYLRLAEQLGVNVILI